VARVACLLPRERFDKTGVRIPEGWEFIFVDCDSERDIVESCEKADFILVRPTYPPITSAIIKTIPSVVLIQTTGAGFDNVDVRAAAALNLPVANLPGKNANAVAAFTLSALVVLQRQMVLADREIKAGNYRGVKEKLMKVGQREISGTKLGLVGLGAIGKQVAYYASAQGAYVSYYKPQRADKEIERRFRLTYMSSLERMLSSNEVVSLHLPLNDSTRGLIGKKEMGLMQPGSFLINTSRGGIVGQWALAEALENGHLGGAALDTLDPEPPPPEHPLLGLSDAAKDKLLLTPHIAGVTAEGLKTMLEQAIDNMKRVAYGGKPENVVNEVSEARKYRQNNAN